ncbi:4928_t:CDS:1, partial [Dentiscutata heterogama]
MVYGIEEIDLKLSILIESKIRKELEYYGKDLTEEELWACANMRTILID